MIFSAEISVISEEILRLRFSNVNDFLKMKIVARELLRSMKRFLNRDALNFLDLDEVAFVNDEEFNLRSEILESK